MASAASGLFSRTTAPQNSMRGLVSFIADLRNARARDLEEKRINKELANIRQKFKGTTLSGYDRKKYVCKLLYIYILGWNVDFGHLEAVNLISANKYSEKQIGYLAVTLFLHEGHELIHLVVNSIRKDLNDSNELYNCLALHAIANVAGRDMAEALAPDVHRLLISVASKQFVKKKAALCLLRLYRKAPQIIQSDWAERIIAMMDDADMGVTLSVTSLVMTLAQDQPETYKASYIKAAQRLRRVLDGDCSADYFYYKVPCPWFQVKVLRLMQYYPPPQDTHVRQLIRDALKQIMENASAAPKNVQQNNAQNAVLFEAINLVIHLDTEEQLMLELCTRLGGFIQSRETNVRYLGLAAMTHLAAKTQTLDPIKEHQNLIIGSLRDRDISIRRQGLDLLYSMCDGSNARVIVAELLKYLQTADYAIRDEMVLKIAIMTEKYATDVQWYVDISLRLISMAGDNISDEIWQRVIQIVTNNEDLQSYAATNILGYLAEPCHESLVKIGAYVLGEFGHLIADEPKCSPIEQMMALQNRFNSCGSSTRAIILSGFVKFVNLFPEIKPQLLQVFRTYSHTLDAELQQRACEYLALATRPTDDLLRSVCDEMPAFPERASALLSRLQAKHGANGDKRLLTSPTSATSASRDVNISANGFGRSTAVSPTSPNGVAINTLDHKVKSPVSELAGLDLSPQKTGSPSKSSTAHLTAGWKQGHDALLTLSAGPLYEDAQIRVHLRSEYRAHVGCLVLQLANKTSLALSSFTMTIISNTNLGVDTKTLPDTSISPLDSTQAIVMFEAKSAFDEPPTMRLSWLAGNLQAVTLQLPIALHKYMEPAILGAEEFFKRWKQIGAGAREAQEIFQGADVDASTTRQVVEGLCWGVLDGVDPNARNFVGATVLHTTMGKSGCLMRLEPNAENKVC